MAITRSQQAKQMLQNGGMLVQPGFGGTRQGYRGDAAAASGAPGMADPGPAGDPSEGAATGAPSRGVLDAKRAFQEARKGLTKSLTQQSRQAALDKALSFLPGGKRSLIGLGLRGITKAFGPKDLGIRGGYNMANIAGPTTTEEEDEQGQGEEDNVYVPPTFAQTQAPMGLPAAIQPQQTMDLNRIAYRFMADGGFLEDDEPRQAYGLGSLVKKVVKKATTLPRKLIKTVKKVAKSPTGRLLLAVAAPYALGPAMASSAALSGFTAAQKAALISGATTGISQLASGEDLDLKDIALSAAIGGTSAKFFPPGGAPKADPTGVAGKARVASDISAGAIPDRAMGQIASRAPTFTGAAEYGITTRPVKTLSLPSSRDFAKIPSARTPDANIFTRIKEGLGNIKDSKVLQFMKDNPTLSILGASGIAGLMAKKDFEEDEFTDQDRGPGIDIAAIRRRPFDYMAPRFAGSQFDFYDTEAADGGRIGFDDGDTDLSNDPAYKGWVKIYETNPDAAAMNENHERYLNFYERTKNAQAEGSKEPVAKKVMPLLDLDGQEMDLRAEGGFVPIGRMEKADDVPARLSKNEFVFTADAVRNAGDGDVDKGAEVMYNMMKNLESGGDVSEESQGLKGARQMFQTSQRLEEVL